VAALVSFYGVGMTRKIVAAATVAASLFFAKAARLETLHEGKRAHVYDDKDGSPLREGYRTKDKLPCKGHPTVGIGCNLDRPNARVALASVGADYNAVRMGRVDLTEKQIKALFTLDLSTAIRQVAQDVAGLSDLPESVQLVLVDMTFNCGTVRKFPKMLEAVSRLDWEGMIREMIDSLWFRQVPARAKHDIEFLRETLEIEDHAQALDEAERTKVLAMVRLTLDDTIDGILDGARGSGEA